METTTGNSVTITVPMNAKGAEILKSVAERFILNLATLSDSVGEISLAEKDDTPPVKRGRGRPPKAETKKRFSVAKAKDEDETEDDDYGSGGAADDAFGDEEETEENETDDDGDEEPDAGDAIRAKKKAPKTAAAVKKDLTLEGDIIPAFKNYAKRHSREDAAKILGRFKVKSVRDLPVSEFGKVLKVLQA